MSDAVHGKSGSVNVGGAITAIRNWSVDPTTDSHDVTSMSSSGKRERKGGIDDWTGSFETNEYPGDLRGTLATATFDTGTAATASTPRYSGSVLVVGVPIETPHDDVIAWTVNFEGNGALTVSTS